MSRPGWRVRALPEVRVLRLAIPALLLLVALECWLLVLRAPVAQWRALRESAAALEAAAEPLTAADVQALRDELARLDGGAGAPQRVARSSEQTVVALIGTLGPRAAGQGVTLGDVAAGPRRPREGLLQADFDVRVRGSYAALTAWLADAQGAIAPLAVTGLVLRGPDAGGALEMALRLSDFQPPPPKEGPTP